MYLHYTVGHSHLADVLTTQCCAESPVDYAHAGPAFITWHRHMNVWLEYETQWLLKRLGKPNYHTFRAPYWDWRREIQLGSGISGEELFTESHLGYTKFTNGYPVVYGQYEDWETVCWLMVGQICDPRQPTGPLQRCPFPDRCTSRNPDWPTMQDVNTALEFETFDSPPWNLISRDGVRSYIDFEVNTEFEACREDRMCLCLSVITGQGDPNCTVVDEFTLALTAKLHSIVRY